MELKSILKKLDFMKINELGEIIEEIKKISSENLAITKRMVKDTEDFLIEVNKLKEARENLDKEKLKIEV